MADATTASGAATNWTALFVELYPKLCAIVDDPEVPAPPLAILFLNWLAPTNVSWLLEAASSSGHGGVRRTFSPNQLSAVHNYFDGDQFCYLCERAELTIDWDLERIEYHVGPNSDIHRQYSLFLDAERRRQLAYKWQRWAGHWEDNAGAYHTVPEPWVCLFCLSDHYYCDSRPVSSQSILKPPVLLGAAINSANQ